MTVEFHPAARAELLTPHGWYQERSPISAAAFVQEIESASYVFPSTPCLRSSRTEHTQFVDFHVSGEQRLRSEDRVVTHEGVIDAFPNI